MKGLETIYRLPIQGYLPAAAEALLTGCLPSAIPVTIQIGRSGAVQEFRLDQLQAFSDALAPCGPEGARALLQSLCAAVLDCPRLLDPALQVFVPDRMFWDGRQSEWRFLLLAGVNDAWTQDDAVDAERLWRTVLTEAMECAPNAREYLQRVWERFQTAPLSAEALRDTLRSVTLTPSTEEIADRDKDCRIWENPPASLGGWSEEFQFPEQPAGEGGGKGTTGTILLPIPGIQRNPRLRRITTQETVPINAERFIIHDAAHRCALMHMPGCSRIVPMDALRVTATNPRELQVQALWKRFHETIAIEGRLNPQLQRGNLPLRFRPNMTEFQPDEPARKEIEPYEEGASRRLSAV